MVSKEGIMTWHYFVIGVLQLLAILAILYYLDKWFEVVYEKMDEIAELLKREKTK